MTSLRLRLKRRPWWFYLSLFLPLALLGSFLLVQKRASCARLKCLAMKDLAEFQVQEVYQDDEQIYRVLLGRDNELLRVQVRSKIEEFEAQQEIQAEVTRMKALFARAPSPYPGEISEAIECAQEFQPIFAEEEINDIAVAYFTGYLNPRLVFGACTPDQAVYRGILALFYCPHQAQLFQLEMVAHKEDFAKAEGTYRERLSSLQCQN